MRSRILLCALAALLALGAAAFFNRERIVLEYMAMRAPKAALAERAALIAPSIQYFLPETAAPPYPAVIQFHGCGGLRQGHMERWAKVANSAGFAAVVVDSYAPRGIDQDRAFSSVCAGKELIGQERAGDVLAAYDIIRQRIDMDASRIVLAGWSHGAWSIMDLIAMEAAGRAPAGIAGKYQAFKPAGAILFYPYCGRGAWTRVSAWSGVPVLALIAGADTVVNAQECLAAFSRLKARGDVDLVEYPDADHVFDEADLAPEHRHFYNADAHADATGRYGAFLDRLGDR